MEFPEINYLIQRACFCANRSFNDRSQGDCQNYYGVERGTVPGSDHQKLAMCDEWPLSWYLFSTTDVQGPLFGVDNQSLIIN